MTDRMKPTSKSWQKRQSTWRHNGFIGSAVMMQKQCAVMLNSPTVDESTKHQARQIIDLAKSLEIGLRSVRIDR